jgi:Xaa-Pro aminopeptidase
MESHDILCDSGALISLTAACLDGLLYFFHENYHVRFIIPPSVEYESVRRPLESNLRKYLFSAIRIKNAIDDGVVVKVDADIATQTNRLMDTANNMFFARGKPLQLIQPGETEMVALARTLGIEYILIDERTTRMLIEAPLKLKEHLEKEFEVNILVNKDNLKSLTSEISPLRALRSSEMVMLAYEKGYFRNFQKLQRDALEAALCKIKYSGCSISYEEINSYVSTAVQPQE